MGGDAMLIPGVIPIPPATSTTMGREAHWIAPQPYGPPIRVLILLFIAIEVAASPDIFGVLTALDSLSKGCNFFVYPPNPLTAITASSSGAEAIVNGCRFKN